MSAATETTPDPFAGYREHLPWCNPVDCTADDGEEIPSHYGQSAILTGDESDYVGVGGAMWRCVPTGDAEVLVRPIEFTGRAAVELSLVGWTAGSPDLSWLTPTEARQLADMLMRAASQAEAVSR